MDLQRWIAQNRAKWQGNAEATEELCEYRQRRNSGKEPDPEVENTRERAKRNVEWNDRY